MKPLKKVLLTGGSNSIEHLANILAQQNPDIEFDYLTSDTATVKAPNLNAIKFDVAYTFPINSANISDVQTMIGNGQCAGFWGGVQWFISHVSDYDLIIAPSLDSQRTNIFDEHAVPTLCSSAAVSQLEADKLYAKQILKEIGIPTPNYRLLNSNNLIEELNSEQLPIVFKMSNYVVSTSGLGFGSWVFTDDSYKNIIPFFNETTRYNQKFYVEDFIKGREVSVHFLCNGRDWKYIGSARDYKRKNNGDVGMNTSGVGCYSPVDYFTDDIKDIVCDYATRLLNYITTNLALYLRGILYLGIIIDENDVPHVLEINTRPGAPEFLSILETVNNSNLLENLNRAAQSRPLLDFVPNNKYSVTINIIHKNYNQIMKFDSQLPDFSDVPEDIIFGSSSLIYTKFNFFCTLTASGNTKEEAANKIYNYLATKDLKDYTYRTDIGFLE